MVPIGSLSIRLGGSWVSGYYTGPVYEAELTFDILDDKGRKRQFGSRGRRRAL